MTIYQSILDTIGSTPVVRLSRMSPSNVDIYVKVESFNPMASVKDRLALGVIEAAERSLQYLRLGIHQQPPAPDKAIGQYLDSHMVGTAVSLNGNIFAVGCTEARKTIEKNYQGCVSEGRICKKEGTKTKLNTKNKNLLFSKSSNLK